MKRILCLLLCMVMLLAACGKTPDPAETTSAPAPEETSIPEATSPETTAPEVMTPGTIQLPMSAIFMPLVTEETTAEDGTVIFSTTYQDVSLTMPDSDRADEIIMDLLHRIDANRESDRQLLSWAKVDYTGQEGWLPYSSEIIYNPVRMDEKVLSLYGMNFSYSGGVHPNYTCISANYDLVTGKVLKLSDVLLNQTAADTLCKMIMEELDAIKDEYYLYDDYARTVSERYGTIFDTTWESTDDWFLNDEGLGIFFSPYDIAPYASGEIRMVFPYEEIRDIINPDYIPAPLPESVPGTVEAALAQDIDLDCFSQFAEAILQEDGEHVVLYTQGLVTNLTLEIGQWDMDGVVFTPAAIVFTANSLTPGDAVLLYTQFSDTMPHIRMRYTSGGEVYQYYLFQSGEDGSILLLDDLI